MRRFREDMLLQFSIVSFVVIAAVAASVLWGGLRPAQGGAPVAPVAVGFLLLYVSFVILFWRAWRTITAQRRELSDYNRILSEKIVELNREILERQTAEAQSAALSQNLQKLADMTKNEFLANMSHEIRTPLNAIIGMTGLLLDMKLGPVQRDYLETIRSSSDTLLLQVNEILDFSQIEAGKFTLEQAEFPLLSCVEEAVDLVAAAAADKNLELICDWQPSLPPRLVGDSTRLRQVLANLLYNAVKFTQKGEICLRVAREQIDPAPADSSIRLHFAVSDTGIGIPPERMELLFESFAQADSSASRRYGGAGLGLAVCKQIVELMGGEMWVESQEGVGSIFHFTGTFSPAATDPAASPLPLPELSGKRILLADDCHSLSDALARQMRAWGAQVDTAATAAGVYLRLENRLAYDVVLLENAMPHLPVAELIERYGGAGQASTAFVRLTRIGEPVAEIPDHSVQHLVKPVKQGHLLRALSLALRPAEDRQATASAPEPAASNPRLKILLAEDNAVNQKVALRILERLNYQADVAANGYAVLDALHSHEYDVILMDLQMPEMDGLEATRILRSELPQARQPYIIAMTANVTKEDRAACFSVGMDDYLGKPVRVRDLKKALEKSAMMKELLTMQTAKSAEKPAASVQIPA